MPSSRSSREAFCARNERLDASIKAIKINKERTALIVHPQGFSRGYLPLFVPNRFDGVQPRSFDRRVYSEDQTDGNGNDKSQKNRADGHDGGPPSEPCNDFGHRKSKNYAQQSAGERDQDGLDDELADDVPSPGADGAAHANFAGTLEDGGQHDVHDPDPTDEKGNGSDGNHDGVEELLRAFLLGQ